MGEFMQFMASPAGIAIFVVVALALVILILGLNYRFFAKALLDFLFGLIFLIVLSPLYAACAAITKRKAGTVLQSRWIVGKGGKPVSVRVFSDFERGGRLGYICRSALKFFPLLLSVVSGKLSLVGPVPLSPQDGALIPDEYEGRFSVRPGLISPAVCFYAAFPEYEEMFAADCDYAKRRSLFFDVRAFFTAALRIVRGEGGRYMKVGRAGYAASLLERGEITFEQFEKAERLADESVSDFLRLSSRVG